MGNELDFIDNPLSCLEKNDPILALNVAELTEDKCTKLKIINYFIVLRLNLGIYLKLQNLIVVLLLYSIFQRK